MVAVGTSVASCVVFAAGASVASQHMQLLKSPMTWAFFFNLAPRRRRFLVVVRLMSPCILVSSVVSSDDVPVCATSLPTLMLALSRTELAAKPLSEEFFDVFFRS